MTEMHAPQNIETKVKEFEQTVFLTCYNRCPQIADTMTGYVTHYCVQCGHGLCSDCVRRVHDVEGSEFRDHTTYTTRLNCSFDNCIHHASFKCTECDVTKPEGVLYCLEHGAMVHGGSHYKFHVIDQQYVFMTLKEQFKPDIQQHDGDNNNNACTVTEDLAFILQEEHDENYIRERRHHHHHHSRHSQEDEQNRQSDNSTVDTTSDSSSSSGSGEDDDDDVQNKQEDISVVAAASSRRVSNSRTMGPRAAPPTTKVAKAVKASKISKASSKVAKAVVNAPVAPLKFRVQKRVGKGNCFYLCQPHQCLTFF